MILVDREKIVQVQTVWLKSYASEREEDRRGVLNKMVDVMENDKKKLQKNIVQIYCMNIISDLIYI